MLDNQVKTYTFHVLGYHRRQLRRSGDNFGIVMNTRHKLFGCKSSFDLLFQGCIFINTANVTVSTAQI